MFAAGTVVLAAACGSGGSSTTTVTAGGGKSSASSKVLTGAGSTLVYPLVSQWEPDYATKAGVTITYGAIGSGGGIDQITARAVDFGASDAPLSADQATACKGCLQIPWALGATVVTYNVKGVPNNLHLTGPVVADMYLGNITSWNDPKIKALNPGVSLPSTKVTPIYRSDGSGDSFVFSSYLSAVSPDFKSKIGASTQPPFSTGTGAAKNSGVAASVQSTDGAIGYVAISYIAAERRRHQGGRGRGHHGAAGRVDPAGEPARLGSGRISAVDLHLRHRAQVVAQGGRAEGVPDVRDHRRPGVRPRPRVPAAAVRGRLVGQDGDRLDLLVAGAAPASRPPTAMPASSREGRTAPA
jgi:ABC-type phosphate transport system substrate-binding protein